LIGFALLQALLERQAAMSEHREFEEREAALKLQAEATEGFGSSLPWRQSWAWAPGIDLDSTKPPEIISLFHQLQRTRSDVAKRPCSRPVNGHWITRCHGLEGQEVRGASEPPNTTVSCS